MGNSQDLGHHFARVASVYGHVRDTDPDIIEEIIPRLPYDKSSSHVADIGCGTGRYSKIIAAKAKSHLQLFCCDYSVAMLQQCRKQLSRYVPSGNTH